LKTAGATPNIAEKYLNILEKFKVEEIILFSGDSDFVYLIKKLKDFGVKVSVYSSKNNFLGA
jgi:uncharacterized LabA/DUF88 family protein